MMCVVSGKDADGKVHIKMKITEFFIRAGALLLKILYPDCCPFCGSTRVSYDGICPACRNMIVETGEPLCKRCGKPVTEDGQEYCHDCRKRKDAAFEAGRSLWLHRRPVSDAVYRLKYQGCRCYARIFAWEMWRRFEWQISRWEIDVLVPVPIHKKRRMQRGYNQAELLARALSEFSGIPAEMGMVVRTKNTSAQKMISGRKRSENLQGAFLASGAGGKYENALVIDDIYTTGSTIEAVAEQLLLCGVKKVYFMTISIGQGF